MSLSQEVSGRESVTPKLFSPPNGSGNCGQIEPGFKLSLGSENSWPSSACVACQLYSTDNAHASSTRTFHTAPHCAVLLPPVASSPDLSHSTLPSARISACHLPPSSILLPHRQQHQLVVLYCIFSVPARFPSRHHHQLSVLLSLDRTAALVHHLVSPHPSVLYKRVTPDQHNSTFPSLHPAHTVSVATQPNPLPASF